MSLTNLIILIVTVGVLVASFVITPRTQTVEGFYKGFSKTGSAPSLWTLVLSQVTTWIFARSLMTAAILGFYYGIAGALAYAAYYLSFVTGGAIIQHLRFKHGYDNVQSFLTAQYGLKGTQEYFLAMLAIGVVTVTYSSMGGLRASLRTDVLQSVIVLALVVFLFFAMLAHDLFNFSAIVNSTAEITSPGWVLLIVAALQLWSYPLHDPVMMDRGFLADEDTTRKSFLHAAWISIVCILMFALLGVFAGLNKAEGQGMIEALSSLFGEPIMIVFSVVLVVSALSTLDSTFSSASKLVVKDMKLMPETVNSGRIVMVAFLILGGVFLVWNNKDLYAAVAVSGTLSMFLLPIIVFSIWGNLKIALWPVVITFVVTVFGAITYVTETSAYKHLHWMTDVFGYEHKYSKLLIICLAIAVVGFVTFAIGSKGRIEKQITD